jgi:hypothetical protein
MVYPINVKQFSLGAGNGSSQRLLVVSTHTPTSPPTDDRTSREAPLRGQGGQSFSSRAVVTSTPGALASIGARGPARHHLPMTFSRLRPRGNRPRGLKRIAATTLDGAGSTPGRDSSRKPPKHARKLHPAPDHAPLRMAGGARVELIAPGAAASSASIGVYRRESPNSSEGHDPSD